MENILVMFNWDWIQRIIQIFRRSKRETWSAELFRREDNYYYDAKRDGNNYNLKNRR